MIEGSQWGCKWDLLARRESRGRIRRECRERMGLWAHSTIHAFASLSRHQSFLSSLDLLSSCFGFRNNALSLLLQWWIWKKKILLLYSNLQGSVSLLQCRLHWITLHKERNYDICRHLVSWNLFVFRSQSICMKSKKKRRRRSQNLATKRDKLLSQKPSDSGISIRIRDF